MKTWQRSLFALCALVALFGGAAYAQAPGAPPVEFPYTGNRTAVWIVAQLHILFAAFILGAPIFVVISEWLESLVCQSLGFAPPPSQKVIQGQAGQRADRRRDGAAGP